MPASDIIKYNIADKWYTLLFWPDFENIIDQEKQVSMKTWLYVYSSSC